MTMQATERLGDLLIRSAERFPHNLAIAFPDRRVSYAELLAQSRARANLLQTQGVQSAEHVGIFMPNCLECLFWIFACALNGSVAVLINSRYRAHELEYVVHHAKLRCLVTRRALEGSPNYIDVLHRTFPDLQGLSQGRSPAKAPGLQQVILAGDGEEGAPAYVVDERQALLNRHVGSATEPPVGADSPCFLLYTSGTTSHPKGCLLSHRMVTEKTAAIVERLQFTESDRQWNPLPLFHLASLMPMFASLATGGAYLCDTHLDAGRAWEQIARDGATILYPAFPAVMAELLTHRKFAEVDKRGIRLVNNVAPPDRLLANMRALPDAVHISAYGLSEATGISCYSHLEDDKQTRAERIGRPLRDTQLRIVDPESGQRCSAGERGEIQLRGSSVFSGYYRASEASRAAFTDDAWFRTGDIGSLDSDGRLAFHGRLKDTLKVGGENVAALEVESLLCTHPAVKLVQVIGVPDTRLNEVVAAFVELNPGETCDADTLIAYCRERVASFKVPRYLRFVTDWPMSATKVQKYRLREQLLAELAEADHEQAMGSERNL